MECEKQEKPRKATDESSDPTPSQVLGLRS